MPIIIEPCDWTSSPLRRFKALPRDGKPVSEWTNANNAYLDVVEELRRILEADDAVQTQPTDSAASLREVEAQPTARRYRVKRDFDDIDHSDFRKAAFAAIRNYFQHAVAEIDSIDDLRGRFVSYSPTSFGCTIVNRARDRGTAHITVHCSSGNRGCGDVFHSFSENAAPNTANGGFHIEADEYELYLSAMMMGFDGNGDRFSPESAAEYLWSEFLQHAGVTID